MPYGDLFGSAAFCPVAFTHGLNDIENEWFGIRVDVVVQVEVGVTSLRLGEIENEVYILLGLRHGWFHIWRGSDD